MKKRLLLIALAGMMVITACNKQKENQGEAQFTATTEHQGGRTSLNPNNGNITWTLGDQIVIANDNDETAVFALQSGEGTTEGGFSTSGEFNTVGPFIAAYPSDAVIGNDKVTFNLPATQSIENTETFANGANPMVACSDDKNLSFKNLCGGLGIRLKGVGAHVSAVRITSKNTTEKLWGTFEVTNCAANEPTLTEASGNQGSNVITLTCDVTLTTAAKTFFVMLPPGTLANGFTMEVLDGNEVLATKETTSDIAMVERNNVKCFNEILIDVEFDGNVEIPTEMSGSDIIVTNFYEDAVPDANGDFFIGYSKVLFAKNTNNGKMVYFTINSKDENIRSSSENDYELNAKETALTIAMRMLPVFIGSCTDEVLNNLKDILYSLQQVKSLEIAIQNTVNTYGYLKQDELDAAIEALKSFIYNELDISAEKHGANKPQAIYMGEIETKQETTNPPYFYPEKMHGTLFKIERSQHFMDPEYWRIECTGYNGLAACFGVVLGYCDIEHPLPSGGYNLDYNKETPLYYLPPASLARGVDILTLGDWEGLKQLFRDIRNKFTDIHYEPLFAKADLENVYLNIDQNTNVLALLSGVDDYRVAMANTLYIIFDGINAFYATGGNFMQSMVSEFLNDPDYVSMFLTEIENGEEGFEAILDATSRKCFEFVSNGIVQTAVQFAGDLASFVTGVSALAHIGDMVLNYYTWTNVKTFGLPVVAEFDTEIALPELVTNSYNVLSSTQARVTGTLINEGTYDVIERGICYGTSPNPTIYNGLCVPAEGTEIGEFTCTLNDLQSETTYFVRSYAINTQRMAGYGNGFSFSLNTPGPVVTTYPVNASSMTSTSAVLSGKVEGSSTPEIMVRGFCYSTNPSVEINAPGVTAIAAPGSGWGEFSLMITGLTPSTTYYYASYVGTSENEIFLGPELSFTTYPSEPILTTYPVISSNTTSTSVELRGKVEGSPSPEIMVRGFCYSTNPSVAINAPDVTAIAAPGSGLGEFSLTITGLTPGTTYYYATYVGTSENEIFLGPELSFHTLPNGGGGGGNHEYVDLGLPSGTLWATCNVGANTPEERGDYFAWGETTPKYTYDWSTYVFCNGSQNTITKYCTNADSGYNGFTDNLSTLLPEDDAATVNWGDEWRMPTKEEWVELKNNTTNIYTSQNGVYGRLFTANNGNSIFLPATSHSPDTEYYQTWGYYWSSSLIEVPYTSYRAWNYWFHENTFEGSVISRYWGYSVRPVRSSR